MIFIPLIWICYGISGQKDSFAPVIVTILAFSIPLIAAGWITAIFSVKNYILTTALTGTCLIFCLLINNDFKHIDPAALTILFLAIPITMAGGIIGITINKKKSISKRLSSPPGNSLQ